MKKVFISQPMRGWEDEEILAFRNIIKMNLEKSLDDDIEIIDSFLQDYPGEINKHIPVYYLGKSIQLLSQADVAYFGGDWKNARGCQIEYAICKKYGIPTIEEWDDILIHTGENLI
ncbi:MAG: hypothetical protein ACLSAJ_12475 [Intestinibacter bartlettii]|uniref:hypothetical protein n=1 Tax=Intestinibacter bartlettii TaxID=261299 RepID=UPI00399FF4C1